MNRANTTPESSRKVVYHSF